MIIFCLNSHGGDCKRKNGLVYSIGFSKVEFFFVRYISAVFTSIVCLMTITFRFYFYFVYVLLPAYCSM